MSTALKSIFACLLALSGMLTAGEASTSRQIEVDYQVVKGPNSRMEAVCVGAGRAAELLRETALKQLREVHQECGFKYLRFHGVFHDELGIFAEGVPKGSYNFQYIDQIYDAILDTGMKPFVELSFMPNHMASGDQTVFRWKGNVTMPKDLAEWGALVKAFTTHMTERYGAEEVKSWYFEVWNEPNHPNFFSGKLPEYLQLYETSVKAIKSVNADYRVGGPATAGNAWVGELIGHCKAKDLPIDFISTHTYGVIGGGLDEFGRKMLKLSKEGASSISSSVAGIRSKINSMPMPKLPLHYTEWSASYSSRDPVHDAYFSAAYILTALKQCAGKADSMSYWTFTDVFEEAGIPPSPFHGGFGLINLQSLRKPSFYAYQFLHRLGDEQLSSADRWATICRSREGVQALIWDYSLPDQDAANQIYFKRDLPAKPKGKVDVVIKNMPAGRYRIDIYGVGYHRNDVYSEFLALGSPANPSREQIADLSKRNSGVPLSTREETVGTEPLRLSLEFRENDVYLVEAKRLP